MPDESPDALSLRKEAFQHFAADRLDEAIETYRRTLELDPKLAIAWNGLAMALSKKGDVEAAIEAGRRLVELEPDDALSHTNLSILYQRNGMIDEAEAEKAEAMRLSMKQES